jgi:SAM-dependent methyltransferase
MYEENIKEKIECRIKPAEFFDVAAQQGFYGLEIGGLKGKKDYVRKYWEDTIIKLTIRDPVEKLLTKRDNIRIVDLGCGSGEGFDLLTHIPHSKPLNPGRQPFILSPDQISSYTGVDISHSMIQQGRKNYGNINNVKFEQADLNKGLLVIDERPFDIYFSSYASLSYLEQDKLQQLVEEIVDNAKPGALIVFDLLGKYSIEWPKYWNMSEKMLPYNMAYLIQDGIKDDEYIHWHDVCYWTPSELYDMLNNVSRKTNKHIKIISCIDRSIFVGRHMETGLFGAPKLNYRYNINRLFDPEHIEDIGQLFIDLDWRKDIGNTQPEIWAHLLDYKTKWNYVITLVNALLHGDNMQISYLIETTSPDMSSELKFLTWLYRNAHRFPITDFWTNIMGPQIAMILRNIEMSMQPALGCGHGLLLVTEIIDM